MLHVATLRTLICLSRVRGWWVRNQKRSQFLWTSSARLMMARQRAWSRQGGESRRLTPARETHWRRFGSGPLNTPDVISVHPPLSPPFCSFCCALMFFKNRCQTCQLDTSIVRWSTKAFRQQGSCWIKTTAKQQTSVCVCSLVSKWYSWFCSCNPLKVCSFVSLSANGK